ncbi:DUF2740 domain-containing protein, partial [Salmonella enterica]|nr:DUF2740 domain-containing protein [Salmonella enterica]
ELEKVKLILKRKGHE